MSLHGNILTNLDRGERYGEKDWKQRWKNRNNGLVFGLCLVGVAAFSTLFAMNQVKQAQKEKNQLVNEQAALPDSATPGLDEALQNALNSPAEEMLDVDSLEEEKLDAAKSLEEMAEGLEVSASDGVTAEMEGQADAAAAEGALPDDSEAGQSLEVQSSQVLPTVSFEDADSLRWPVAGNVVLDYSMDGSIYFPTLNQYKYNPALVIGSDVGAQVVAAAKGIVENIDIDEETGTTVTMSLGNGYKLKYGQLKELTVAEGDVVEEGALIGYVSEPTKYYCVEGSNLFFEMTKDETPVDPVLYLE